MPTFVTLEASTREPRQRATGETLRVLGENDGCVTSSNQLGGLALMLHVELPASAARDLGTRLDAIGVRLDAPSRAALRGADACVGSFLLRFYGDEPDAKVEIPKVPG